MTVSLASSRAFCRDVTRRAATSFYWPSLLLPRPRRQALHAVYAFMRLVDDVADDGGAGEPSLALAAWEDRLRAALEGQNGAHPVLPALLDAVTTYRISPDLLFELIRGAGMDLTRNRYDTFADLAVYCRRVASVVGLVCVRIFGCADPAGDVPAEALGMAFQLTNILRDVGEDAGRGRIYIPLEDCRRFSVREEDILARRRSSGFDALMAFEADRARSFFEEGEAVLPLVPRRTRPCLAAMRDIYRTLLEAVAASGFDVLTRRVTVPTTRRFLLALRAIVVPGGSGPR